MVVGLYVCMCVCMYIGRARESPWSSGRWAVCMCVCMYVCVFVSHNIFRSYVCMYVYILTYTCMYVCMYVCMYIGRARECPQSIGRWPVCMYVCMYFVCIYLFR